MRPARQPRYMRQATPGTIPDERPQERRSIDAREQDAARYEPVFNLPPVVLALIGVCALVYVVGAYLLSETVLSPAGQRRLHPDPVQRPVRSRLHGVHLAVHLCVPARLVAHLAINMIWLAAFGSPLANRLGALQVSGVLGADVGMRRGTALVLHMSTGRAGRRVGRDLGHDGCGRPLRLPDRSQPRRRGILRRTAADRRVPALARGRHVPVDLDAGQSADRAGPFRARHRRPDRLGGAYRRLPRRISSASTGSTGSGRKKLPPLDAPERAATAELTERRLQRSWTSRHDARHNWTGSVERCKSACPTAGSWRLMPRTIAEIRCLRLPQPSSLRLFAGRRGREADGEVDRLRQAHQRGGWSGEARRPQGHPRRLRNPRQPGIRHRRHGASDHG